MELIFMPFIVVFDDQSSLCLPMGVDTDCEGAICISAGSNAIAMFENRNAAKKAIRISKLFAELQEAQGKPANEDFLSGYKYVRIRKVESA
jgi:hypothetical protein